MLVYGPGIKKELAIFPDGKYGFSDVIENDGIEGKSYMVAIDMNVEGDEVVADYDRSSPQAKGPINAARGFATGAVYNGLLHVTDPSIPKNSGTFWPIRVVSPPGRVTNVDYPGSLVAGNTETPPAARQHHHRRLRAGAGHGLGKLHRDQFRLPRQPSRL
jgi:N-methylhydantoinase B